MTLETDAPASRQAAMPPLCGGQDAAPLRCYHCGDVVAPGIRLAVRIEGQDRPMCCRGCEAVARTIVDAGLQRYYRLRETGAPKPQGLIPEEIGRMAAFDDPVLQKYFVDAGAGASRSAALILEGINCPACCWLIERRLAGLPGMKEAVVNFASQRATVTWDHTRLRLSAILQAVAQLGYRAHPYDPRTRAAVLEVEGRSHLRRIGLAGLLGMQVMMLSVALYLGDWSGMDSAYRRFFYWIAMFLTVPVITYSARPFFLNAWRDIHSLRLGMDVPVSLGIALAFLGSLQATLAGQGHVYFDSIVMFVFILLLGRYMEFRVRGRASRRLDHLARVVPAVATRLEPDDTGARGEHTVPVAALRPGDIVLVRPGATIPSDGTIVDGDSSVDEAVITGESLPRRRRPGDAVIGGSTNFESPIQVRVERVGAETVLSRIARLVEQGQAEKPALAVLAERTAAWFVFVVLLLALAVACYWWNLRPEDWLPITVSVLVVTCPCALALATPTALAGAISVLMREGTIVTRANALETLNRATTYVFDKTGTLTRGRLVLQEIKTLADRNAPDCLAIAAALEQGSEHPIARAVRTAGAGLARAVAAQSRNYPGEGITGRVGDVGYFLGNAAFVRRMTGRDLPDLRPGVPGEKIATVCWLADATGPLAILHLGDELRPEARDLIDYLARRGRKVVILSGDSQTAVDDLAARLGVRYAIGGCSPEQKVDRLRTFGAAGEVTCMTGDGVNDAPVLAVAHVSVAMGGATDLALASADMVLPGGRLASLQRAQETAVRTMQVIRQNIAWAIGYNLLALPIAAAGWITPWMAALGMSLSSVLVVANSARLSRGMTD